MSLSSTDPDLDRLDLDEIARFLARRWRLIVGAGVGCALLAALVCLMAKPVYTATSQVLLDPQRSHLFGQETVPQDTSLDSSIVDSQIPIILSTRLLAKVVTKENLADDPEFGASAKPGLLERLISLIRPAKPKPLDTASLDGIDPRLAPAIVHLFNKVDVTRVAKSYVLAIAVSSHSPAKAARLANTIAQTYVEDQVDVHAKAVQQAATFFENHLGSLRDQVRASERAVAEFRRLHGLSTTVMDGKVTVGEQQLQDLNAQLALATTDTAEKLARYQQAARFRLAGDNVETLPEIIRSSVVGTLRAQQADLMRRQADLTAVYGPAYPAITQIHAELIGLDKAIAAEIKRSTAALKNDYEVAKVREDTLRQTISRLSDTAGGDNDVGVKLRELERTNLANKALFENFLNRAKLTQEQTSFEEPDARLISPALEPSSPSSPKTKLVVPVAGLAGLLLGLFAAAGLDRFGTRHPPAERNSAARLILAQLPYVSRRPGRANACMAEMTAEPDGEFARAVGQFASGLGSGENRVVLISSLAAGEGTTSLALCAALAAGLDGRRVLLVDCGAPSDQATGPVQGLSDVLAGTCSATRAMARGDHFDVMPSGAAMVRSKAASQGLGTFLDEASRRYDLVILDGPPLDEADGTAALIELVDEIVLVSSWGHLKHDSFVPKVDSVARHSKFQGLVLNKTDDRPWSDYAMAS